MKYYFKYRSAITGEFVSEQFAKKHKKTTVRERVKIWGAHSKSKGSTVARKKKRSDYYFD